MRSMTAPRGAVIASASGPARHGPDRGAARYREATSAYPGATMSTDEHENEAGASEPVEPTEVSETSSPTAEAPEGAEPAGPAAPTEPAEDPGAAPDEASTTTEPDEAAVEPPQASEA